MSYLVVDIETKGQPYEEFDEKSKDFFKEWAIRNASTDAEVEQELEAVKEGLPLSPFMGEVVSIAVLDDKDKGAVYFQAPEEDLEDWEDDGVQYRVGTEKEILEKFWDVAKHYDLFVTFNGRGFDAPYLMIRAAVHGIRSTKNLMGYRYQNGRGSGTQHVDLADQFAFYGAMRRTSLHFITRAFGIESPKQGDVEGKEVPQAFADKRYKEIAEYNFADVVATRELYEKWNEYINI